MAQVLTETPTEVMDGFFLDWMSQLKQHVVPYSVNLGHQEVLDGMIDWIRTHGTNEG